jgi:hypothetical protein
MLRTAIVTIMLAGLATVAAADSVYKWVDVRGQIHYTDLPPDESGAKLLGVFERDLVLEETEAPGESPGDEPQFDDSTPPEESTPGAAAAAAVQRDVNEVRSAQCKQAQERYKTYVESKRLYRETADGKRVYLSDADLTKTRIEAKQAVDDLCK